MEGVIHPKHRQHLQCCASSYPWREFHCSRNSTEIFLSKILMYLHENNRSLVILNLAEYETLNRENKEISNFPSDKCVNSCPLATGKTRLIEKSNNFIENQTHDLPACSIVPQPTTLPRASSNINAPELSNLYAPLNKQVIHYLHTRHRRKWPL
jgi:hypothetical protein